MSTRGRPFEPGNKFGRGRPRGSRNKKSSTLEEMLQNRGPEIVTKAIEEALKGDRAALKLCMDRLMAPLKSIPELPVEESQEGPHVIEIVFVKSPNDTGADGESTNPSPQLPAAEPPGIRNQPVPVKPKFPVATPPRPKLSIWS